MPQGSPATIFSMGERSRKDELVVTHHHAAAIFSVATRPRKGNRSNLTQ